MNWFAGGRKVALILALLVWIWPLSRPLFDRADSSGYWATTMSVVDDGDVFYLDQYRELDLWERYFRPTPRGLPGNHWAPGLGVALVPTYGLARTLEPSAKSVSVTTMAASQSTALLWAAVAVALGFVCARRLGSARHAAVAVTLAYLGTPLVFYTHAQAIRPHLLEALLTTCFVWVCLFAPNQRALKRSWALGWLASALVLVRPQAALILLLPLWQIALIWWPKRRSIADARQACIHGLALMALPLGAVWLSRGYTQLLYGPARTGSLFDSVWLAETAIMDSLFHPHHGLFSWSPLHALALVGLVLFFKRHPRFAVPVAAFVLVQVYLNGTNYDQSVDAYHHTRHIGGGFSFGARRYANLFPLVALGLVSLFQALTQHKALRVTCLTLACLSTAWNLNLAHYARIHGEILLEPFDWATMLNTQATAVVALGETTAAWFTLVPSPRAALIGWAGAIVQGGVGLVLWHLFARGSNRRRVQWVTISSIIALIAITATATLVPHNTERAVEARQDDIHEFQDLSAARTRDIERDITAEQARLQAIYSRGN